LSFSAPFSFPRWQSLPRTWKKHFVRHNCADERKEVLGELCEIRHNIE
jgi:hypothetical protein